jgi:hypothetical protein
VGLPALAEAGVRRLLIAVLIATAALPALAGQHHLLIISGIGGNPEYSQRFNRQAERLAEAAAAAGIAPTRIHRLSAESQAARSEKAGIVAAVEAIAAASDPGDRIFVVLIGHGNARSNGALFNLPGPDISATELAAALEPLGSREQVVVNTASASGPFIAPLSAAHRVVITATSSGREFHAPLFADYFIAAFASDGADRDKDERISMLEAFEYARREVRRDYEGEKRMLIEHALLDDNGDGKGSLEPGEFRDDGALAHRIHLQQPLSVADGAAPELVAMQERKQALEVSISELKRRRDSLPRADYYAELEILLVELALLNRQMRAEGD